jgi:acyl-CoA reductase-like NAD-dependent aldehyde dehydrogenase
MQELTHYIGGQHVKGKSGRFADVMNPATGEVQAKVPLASNDEMAKPSQSRRKRKSTGPRPIRKSVPGF